MAFNTTGPYGNWGVVCHTAGCQGPWLGLLSGWLVKYPPSGCTFNVKACPAGWPGCLGVRSGLIFCQVRGQLAVRCRHAWVTLFKQAVHNARLATAELGCLVAARIAAMLGSACLTIMFVIRSAGLFKVVCPALRSGGPGFGSGREATVSIQPSIVHFLVTLSRQWLTTGS